MITRVWSRLETYQAQTPKNRYATVLQLRRDFPKASIDEIAVKLGEITHTQVTPEAFRKNLQRARAKFIELLDPGAARNHPPHQHRSHRGRDLRPGARAISIAATARPTKIDPFPADRPPAGSIRPICLNSFGFERSAADENSPLPLTHWLQHVQFNKGSVRNLDTEGGVRPDLRRDLIPLRERNGPRRTR